MKKIYKLILISIFLFIGINIVKADGPVMYLECKRTDEGEGNWIFFRGTEGSDTNIGTVWYFLDPDGNKIYKVDWCWFQDSEEMDEWCDTRDNYNSNSQLANGVCPEKIRKSKEGNNRVLAGIGETIKAVRMEENQYSFYLYNHSDNNFTDYSSIMVEYYDYNGNFVHLASRAEWGEPAYIDKYNLISKDAINFRENFFRLGNTFNFTPKYIISSGRVPESGYSKSIEIIFDSGDNKGKLKSAVDDWYNDNIEVILKENESYNSLKKDYNKLLYTCDAFNSKMEESRGYQFFSDYTAHDMLNDLSGAIPIINNVYNNTTEYKLCSNQSSALALNSATNCAFVNLLGGLDAVDNTVFKLVADDVSKMLNEYDAFPNIKELTDDELKKLVRCSSYLDKYSDDYGLNSEDTSDVRKEYEAIAGDRGISVIIDCEGLLGQELVDKINSYLDIVKIVIPIILIGFGIFDFAKAVFAGTEENMKKAQQDFIKRLGIAILIFFVPTIVNIILNIANKVWGIISPDTCGLF